jgi:hypothetical protein
MKYLSFIAASCVKPANLSVQANLQIKVYLVSPPFIHLWYQIMQGQNSFFTFKQAKG